jgi:hypothetical protein
VAFAFLNELPPPLEFRKSNEKIVPGRCRRHAASSPRDC